MPQPMVIILSAQSANSCVSNLGRWASRLVPQLGHDLHGNWIHPLARLRARGTRLRLAVGKLTEKRLRHLTAPRIVHTDEEYPFQSRFLPKRGLLNVSQHVTLLRQRYIAAALLSIF